MPSLPAIPPPLVTVDRFSRQVLVSAAALATSELIMEPDRDESWPRVLDEVTSALESLTKATTALHSRGDRCKLRKAGFDMSSIIVAAIAAVASVFAAVIAGVFARSVRRLESQLQRRENIHERNIERKQEMYAPVIELIQHMFVTDDQPTEEQLEKKRHFDLWSKVYCPDDVLAAYSRFSMIGNGEYPPGEVQVRLYADLLLAIRKDLGDPYSNLTRLELMGNTTGLYEDKYFLTEPNLDRVCKRYNYTPPWKNKPTKDGPAPRQREKVDTAAQARPSATSDSLRDELPNGWNGLRWGASSADFKALFPTAEVENGWHRTGLGNRETHFGMEFEIVQFSFGDTDELYMVVCIPNEADRPKVTPAVVSALGMPPNTSAKWTFGDVSVEVKAHGLAVVITNAKFGSE
jgi:hypothetical protein